MSSDDKSGEMDDDGSCCDGNAEVRELEGDEGGRAEVWKGPKDNTIRHHFLHGGDTRK